MRNTDNLIKTMLLCLLICVISSCDKKDTIKTDIKINKISIDGIGDFDYKDSLVYAAVDTVIYKVSIITEPTNANIYYKTGLGDYIKLTTNSIVVDSTTKKLSFYADKDGYNKTPIKSMDFAFNNDSLIKSFDLYPNPTVGQLKIGLNSKTRGVLMYNIYDVTGLLKMTKNEIVLKDSFLVSTYITQFSKGIYILKLNYGETKLMMNLIKQ